MTPRQYLADHVAAQIAQRRREVLQQLIAAITPVTAVLGSVEAADDSSRELFRVRSYHRHLLRPLWEMALRGPREAKLPPFPSDEDLTNEARLHDILGELLRWAHLELARCGMSRIISPLEDLRIRCRDAEGAFAILEAGGQLTLERLKQYIRNLDDTAMALRCNDKLPQDGCLPPERPAAVENKADALRYVHQLQAWLNRPAEPPADERTMKKSRKPHPRPNEARDKWVAARKERKKHPMTWEAIYEELLAVAEKKKWTVPSDARALAEAYRRNMTRERKQKRRR